MRRTKRLGLATACLRKPWKSSWGPFLGRKATEKGREASVEVFCEGPEPPLLDAAARRRARDPSLYQLAFIPATFVNSGMELETFDSFEAAEERMNGLRSSAKTQEIQWKSIVCSFEFWF